jgi:NAD+ diphosphatase
MIHEILPHSFDNRFVICETIGDDDFVLHYNENSLLLKINGNGFELPRKKDISGISDTTEKTFLVKLNDVFCFLLWDKPKTDDNQFVYKEINFFRTFEQPEIAWTSIVGFHLMNWYLQNKYCGKCGSKTKKKLDERALVCTNCNTTVYPQISPAVIVAVIKNDKILLARNSNFTNNWFSLVAGYVDIGESLEETVMREVKEEVGLNVKNIHYYKSQPWPFSGSMMIGFFAEADDKQSICVDNKEITEASWFSRGNLPNHPPNLSIAGEMIEKFEKGEI